jgi:hypothetical protein
MVLRVVVVEAASYGKPRVSLDLTHRFSPHVAANTLKPASAVLRSFVGAAKTALPNLVMKSRKSLRSSRPGR